MTSKWWADLYCTAVEQLLFMLCTDVKRISTILFSARLSSMRQSREFRRMHSRQHGPGGRGRRTQPDLEYHFFVREDENWIGRNNYFYDLNGVSEAKGAS
jgi:hypothetical protein